jgi:hypothetical protein
LLSAARISSLDAVSDARSPRPRRKSAQPPLGISSNTGPLATTAWLIERGLSSREPRWFVEIMIGTSDGFPDKDAATLLRIELFSEEWGFWFQHDNKVSWIRVTDLRFVHGRDEHSLLRETPALGNLGALVRALEKRFDVRFVVETPLIRTNLFGAEPAINEWLRSW